MNKLLLVEGLGDQSFVEGFLSVIGKPDITPFPPKQLGGPSNGVSNVLKVIPLLINQILSGTTSEAGILVDADTTGVNGGFTLRRQEITSALQSAGYTIPAAPLPGTPPGELFTHPAGHASIGLFILPNHRDDGMLEDVLKNMVTSAPYSGLLQHATTVVGALTPKLFNDPLHRSKAEINTFLAWQNPPPAQVRACVTSQIFDATSPAATNLVHWLNMVFP